MIVPMDKVLLRINKCFPDNVIVVLFGIRIRGFLILDLKRISMSIHDLHYLVVVINMRIGVWSVKIVVMGVVRMATLGRGVLMIEKESKLLLVM